MNPENSNSKNLLPYFDVYQFGHIADTVLPNGAFIKFLANSDTTDDNLYIKYGNRSFDSILVWESSVPTTHCRTPGLFYFTDRHIALYYSCMNSRGMVLLPLNDNDDVKYFAPIFIDTTHKTVLVEDYDGYKNDNCFDTLTIANFDFTKQKFFIISHIVCSDRLSCIDTVYLNKSEIVLKSAASTPCDDIHDPQAKFERTRIPWIK
jgi:hypothetical protein